MSQPDNTEILARMKQFNDKYQDTEPPTIPLSACISGTALDETSVDLAAVSYTHLPLPTPPYV